MVSECADGACPVPVGVGHKIGVVVVVRIAIVIVNKVGEVVALVFIVIGQLMVVMVVVNGRGWWTRRFGSRRCNA
jgi:hypothetical protein